eukprot:TRINITY_DN1997_c0_g1_i1.p1 TRINITY_DN1997_c0_g1~~TRINITY_DN1997_c0_g1_i1.p1  ORF type:complete len:128 (+),score=22.38 TRINITY_DN1997_c0_g1_i1:52-435(+)
MSGVSLSRLYRDHQAAQEKKLEQAEQLRTKVSQAVDDVSHGLLDSVNIGVANVFANERRLDQEAKALQSSTQKLSKQTANWVSLIASFNDALKELGDIENWAHTIENDMLTISTSLEFIHKNMDARQ